ncbi:MAG: hypothetical protein QQN49_06325 [Nitrosopumilus sp.]
MELEKESLDHLEQLLQRTLESFEGLSARWTDLQPQQEFYIKISEDFNLGFVFGKLEDDFVGWFYSVHGRSMTDQEYYQFWKICRKHVRSTRKKSDVFDF